MDNGHRHLAERTGTKHCQVPGCPERAEPKSRLCLKCQLAGLRAPRERKERFDR